MEKIDITYANHYHLDDFDELNLRINNLPSQPSSGVLVDDEHNAFLKIAPETGQIVGATIVYADDWFAEIARAFQQGDTSNRDVKFFLEQKIQQWSLVRESQLRAERAMELEKV